MDDHDESLIVRRHVTDCTFPSNSTTQSQTTISRLDRHWMSPIICLWMCNLSWCFLLNPTWSGLPPPASLLLCKIFNFIKGVVGHSKNYWTIKAPALRSVLNCWVHFLHSIISGVPPWEPHFYIGKGTLNLHLFSGPGAVWQWGVSLAKSCEVYKNFVLLIPGRAFRSQ